MKQDEVTANVHLSEENEQSHFSTCSLGRGHWLPDFNIAKEKTRYFQHDTLGFS